jgi:hypothetical protein
MDNTAGAHLLEAALGGDEQAARELFRQSVDPVFDLAARVSGSHETAARITTEVLERAASTFASARPGPDVRAWFFGLAWGVLAHEGLFAASAAVQTGPPGEPAARLASLGPRMHAILDLSLRQGLDASALARVLHISRANAAVLCDRVVARGRARLGGDAAQVLAAYASLPPLGPPAGYAARLVEGLRFRFDLVRTVGRQPVPLHRGPSWAFRRLAAPLAGVALLAIAVVSMLVPASPFAVVGGRDGGEVPLSALPPDGSPSATTRPARPPTSTATARASATVTSPTSGPAAGATAIPSATPTARAATVTSATPATPGATASPTPAPPETPSPPPTPTPQPCAPVLAVSVSSVTVLPGRPSFFPVFNTAFCAPLTFSVSVQVSDGAWLSAEPLAGTIPTGQSVDIHLAANPPSAPGTYRAVVRVTGPNNVIEVAVVSVRE